MTLSRPSVAGEMRANPSDRCIVDTDVISFIFRSDTRADFYRDYLIGRQPGVCFQTLAELRRWALINNWGATRRQLLEQMLNAYAVYVVDEVLIDAWATILHRAHIKGRLIATGDAWIAATAWVQRVPLVTHNVRHFQHIDGLDVISAESDHD